MQMFFYESSNRLFLPAGHLQVKFKAFYNLFKTIMNPIFSMIFMSILTDKYEGYEEKLEHQNFSQTKCAAPELDLIKVVPTLH